MLNSLKNLKSFYIFIFVSLSNAVISILIALRIFPITTSEMLLTDDTRDAFLIITLLFTFLTSFIAPLLFGLFFSGIEKVIALLSKVRIEEKRIRIFLIVFFPLVIDNFLKLIYLMITNKSFLYGQVSSPFSFFENDFSFIVQPISYFGVFFIISIFIYLKYSSNHSISHKITMVIVLVTFQFIQGFISYSVYI